jgi:hypothetical protein
MESLYDVLQHMDVGTYPLYETYKPSSRDHGVRQLNVSKLIITWMLHYYGVATPYAVE